MNWTEAVAAMQAGALVQRETETTVYQAIEDEGFSANTLPIFVGGVEPIRLAVAYTDRGDFVRIFQGAGSRVLFEPTDEHMQATDWLRVEPHGGWYRPAAGVAP